MSIKKTLGGDRLGAGKKMQVELHNYERSTHDLGYIWRNTQSVGTLVPFMSMIALPGDTFDIDMGADVKTYPTLGPLFGSFKLQLDVFQAPIRLYQGQLHNNKLGIGMNMSKVKLPQLKFEIIADEHNGDAEKISPDKRHISNSSLMAYLGIRGLGRVEAGDNNLVDVKFNAVPMLAYWDIYKNYYANKQEEIGMYINSLTGYIEYIRYNWDTGGSKGYVIREAGENAGIERRYIKEAYVYGNNLEINNIEYWDVNGNEWKELTIIAFEEVEQNINYIYIKYKNSNGTYKNTKLRNKAVNMTNELKIEKFQLENIDRMREDILSGVKDSGAFEINYETYAPYGPPMTPIGKMTKDEDGDDASYTTIPYSNEQVGLGLKTYQSDIYNNWLSTEWIDGENGISAITAIDTTGDSFTIDTLNLSKKVYDMLNRIAVSGGSYDDWLQAVWSHNPIRRAESPIYHGGLSKEIIFQEVVSTAETDTQQLNVLGELGGKGALSNKHKGGKVTIKVDEPSYLIGIISITPRIDYSQGNQWDVNLKTMDDFHKPALDQIGFQELITDQMASWERVNKANGTVELRSAGKQPAWINYMTNYNKAYGNFAEDRKEMYMTLNRRYEYDKVTKQIKDLTTYIDPRKYNYIFAHTDLSAMNFWVQVGTNITARRKMSAKVMPNL